MSASPRAEWVPRREEWGLINNQKLAQYYRMKELEKIEDLQTKKEIKQELDMQVTMKKGRYDWQKDEDRKYREYVNQKTAQLNAQQEREKHAKYLKRKQVEAENRKIFDQMSNSGEMRDAERIKFEIGAKSELEHRQRQQKHKKEMVDTLDQQIEIKQKQRIIQKYHDRKIDDQNLKYQYDQFDRRKYHPKYKDQNMNVYDQFKSMEVYKKNKEDELHQILVEEAAERKKRDQKRKMEAKEMEMFAKKNEMKKILDFQIEQQKHRIEEEKKANPEDVTYGVLRNIFKDKEIPFNKKEYSEYLRKQAEEHKEREKLNRYMSDQQYRLNLNHLNRAVNGLSPRQQYLDRSIVAIGDHPARVSPKKRDINFVDTQPLNDQDVGVVKMKLENIKQRDSYRHNFY